MASSSAKEDKDRKETPLLDLDDESQQGAVSRNSLQSGEVDIQEWERRLVTGQLLVKVITVIVRLVINMIKNVQWIIKSRQSTWPQLRNAEGVTSQQQHYFKVLLSKSLLSISKNLILVYKTLNNNYLVNISYTQIWDINCSWHLNCPIKGYLSKFVPFTFPSIFILLSNTSLLYKIKHFLSHNHVLSEMLSRTSARLSLLKTYSMFNAICHQSQQYVSLIHDQTVILSHIDSQIS